MPRNSPPDNSLIAAVDLGSNSFHLAVARMDHGQIRLLTTLSEKVQLAAGLDDKDRLTEEAQSRALECLSRFSQHLKGVEPQYLRVVGTNALRVAKNARQLTDKAAHVLGQPVEIIAGREEARLIYLGVAQTLASSGRRLVVDIGGGSTEFIIGERHEPLATESLHMGCVSYTMRFFADGSLSPRQIERAITAARLEVTSIQETYREIGWSQVVGSSGTIKAVQQIQQQLGLAHADGSISLKGLREMHRQLLKLTHVRQINLPGLKDDRKTIMPAGLCILLGIFEELGIDRMEYSDGALREGVLHDMVGRFLNEDMRDHSVQAMMARYHVDTSQAERVSQLASHLFQQAASQLVLNEDDNDLLRWAARLHEVGTAISHSSFHKHGAYLLKHSDMPGFSRQTQERLALLVGTHRRKIKAESYNEILESGGLTLLRLCAILRLSVLLHHSRSRQSLPAIQLRSDGIAFNLTFPRGWLEQHPLTQADLAQEAETFASIDLKLLVSEC